MTSDLSSRVHLIARPWPRGPSARYVAIIRRPRDVPCLEWVESRWVHVSFAVRISCTAVLDLCQLCGGAPSHCHQQTIYCQRKKQPIDNFTQRDRCSCLATAPKSMCVRCAPCFRVDRRAHPLCPSGQTSTWTWPSSSSSCAGGAFASSSSTSTASLQGGGFHCENTIARKCSR